MQLTPSSNAGSAQSVTLFMDQSNVPRDMPPAAAAGLFSTQNGVAGLQTTTSSSVQQPGTLFQSAVNGTLNQPGQAPQSGLLFFELRNGKNSGYTHKKMSFSV